MKHNPFLPLCLLSATLFLHPAAAQITPAEYRRAVAGHSWSLRAAASRSEQAAQRQLRARTAFLPSLSAAGDFSLALRHRTGIKPWGFALQPQIVGTLYGGGSVRASWRKASLDHSAALCDEAFTLLDVRYAADYAYWNLSATTQYRDAMRRFVGIIRSLKELIDRRFEEGYISKSDVLMIEARLSAAEYEELAAEKSCEEALHTFNVLRGTGADDPVALAVSILDSLAMPRRATLEETLAARPDYTAARLRREAAASSVRLVRSAFNPRIEVGVSGIWQPETPNRRGVTSLDGALFARVSVPIFHFRERRHAVAEARAAELKSAWGEAQLHDDILLQERNGWTALTESRAQVEAIKESLRIASENLDLSTYSYGEGLTTILDVLQAQLSWIQLYTNAITARFNYAVARSSYDRITARETDEEQ